MENNSFPPFMTSPNSDNQTGISSVYMFENGTKYIFLAYIKFMHDILSGMFRMNCLLYR